MHSTENFNQSAFEIIKCYMNVNTSRQYKHGKATQTEVFITKTLLIPMVKLQKIMGPHYQQQVFFQTRSIVILS